MDARTNYDVLTNFSTFETTFCVFSQNLKNNYDVLLHGVPNTSLSCSMCWNRINTYASLSEGY